MKIWIQHSDFTEDEFELDLISTLRMFQDVDWLNELAIEKKRSESGDESCPPGLGIVHPTERILHVCPNPSGALVHYHYPQKVMGLFNRQKTLTLEKVRPDQIERFVHAFFNQEWDVIKSHS